MKLYNKGGRAFIISVDNIISGGRFQENDNKKERKYFDPETDIEVKDEYGIKLMGMYPKELKKVGESSPAKKAVKRRKKVQV